MEYHDLEVLKALLKKGAFDKARIATYDSVSEFTSETELIQYFLNIGPFNPRQKEGSFILLKCGAWIEWTCHAAGYDYIYCWELRKRPSW